MPLYVYMQIAHERANFVDGLRYFAHEFSTANLIIYSSIKNVYSSTLLPYSSRICIFLYNNLDLSILFCSHVHAFLY